MSRQTRRAAETPLFLCPGESERGAFNVFERAFFLDYTREKLKCKVNAQNAEDCGIAEPL